MKKENDMKSGALAPIANEELSLVCGGNKYTKAWSWATKGAKWLGGAVATGAAGKAGEEAYDKARGR